MFCDSCGSNITDNSKFCKNCGKNLTEATPAASTVQPVQVESQAPPPYPNFTSQPQPQPQPSNIYQPPQQTSADTNNSRNTYDASIPANRKPLGVGSYIGMFILLAIPVVGFILLLVWAFGRNTNLNRKNYARAVLIMGLIGLAIALLLVGVGVAVGWSFFNDIFKITYTSW